MWGINTYCTRLLWSLNNVSKILTHCSVTERWIRIPYLLKAIFTVIANLILPVLKLRTPDNCPLTLKKLKLWKPSPNLEQQTRCNLLSSLISTFPSQHINSFFILFWENVLQTCHRFSNVNVLIHINSCLECHHSPWHFCLMNSHLNFTAKFKHYLCCRFSQDLLYCPLLLLQKHSFTYLYYCTYSILSLFVCISFSSPLDYIISATPNLAAHILSTDQNYVFFMVISLSMVPSIQQVHNNEKGPGNTEEIKVAL